MTTENEAGKRVALDEDDPLDPVAFGEFLQSDNDQLVLVPRGEWSHMQASKAERPPAAPAVLLPFSWKELVARFSQFVRDSNSSAASNVTRFGDICVDFFKMKVTRSSGESITLTSQQFKTLKYFLLNPDKVLSRDELLNEAWGYENYPSTRTVDNHVLKLRQKLEKDPARPVHFRTVHGVGYKFVP